MLKLIRRALSYLAAAPLLPAAVFSLVGWCLGHLSSWLEMNVSRPLVRAGLRSQRWVAGDPLWQPADFGMNPNTAQERDQLRAFARAKGYTYLEPIGGGTPVLLKHDHEGPCSVHEPLLVTDERDVIGGLPLRPPAPTGPVNLDGDPPRAA